jgi:hypothetical protein
MPKGKHGGLNEPGDNHSIPLLIFYSGLVTVFI